MQKWSSTPPIWQTIQPFYFNGNKAVFLAEDILSALKQLDVTSSDLDEISISAYTGDITLKNAKILVKAKEIPSAKGDVNADGKFDIADVVTLQKWILAVSDVKIDDWKAADLYEDNKINVLDLCIMKRELIK